MMIIRYAYASIDINTPRLFNLCSKKLRPHSAVEGEQHAASCPCSRSSHLTMYQRQVEQIKLLAAHYRSPGGIEEPPDFSATSCLQDQGEHRATTAKISANESRTRGCNNVVHQALDTKQQSDGVVNAGEVHSGITMGICGYKRCDGQQKGYCGNAVKFTPLNFLAGNKKGDNRGANRRGSGSTCTVQPMRLSEPAASVVNMPSLLQGQDFSDPIFPPLHTGGRRQHRRSNSQPATLRLGLPLTYWGQVPGECSCCLRGRGVSASSSVTTGWRRGVHSATMYTRYRSPEYALMYGDLESMTTASTGSSEWPVSKCRKIENISKFG